MMRKLNISEILFWITAVILFAVFIFNRKSCNPITTELKVDTITVTDSFIKYDTVFQEKEIKVKQAKKIIYVEVPAEVDTTENLKKYYAKVLRDDTLMNDSGLFFRLQQEITKNDVVKQTIEVHDYEKTKVITEKTTIKIPVPTPKYYIGTFCLFQENDAVIGGKLMFRTNKNIYVSAGCGTKKTVYVDVVIPINKLFTKKNK